MAIFQCSNCNFKYDEEKEGKKFNELPEEWTCRCGNKDKETFIEIEEEIIEPSDEEQELKIENDNLILGDNGDPEKEIGLDGNPENEIDQDVNGDENEQELLTVADERALFWEQGDGVFIDFKKLGFSIEEKCLNFRFQSENQELMFFSIAAEFPEYYDPRKWITEIGKGIDGYIVQVPQKVAAQIKKEYEPFIEESYIQERGHPKIYKLEIPSLYQFYKDHDPNIPIERWKEQSQRRVLTTQEKNELKNKFKNKCAITGITLDNENVLNESMQSFCTQLKIIEFDHRIPFDIDPDQDQNPETAFMLLSQYINNKKKDICIKCKVDENVNCKECALAFPEHYTKIVPTQQDISEFRTKNWGW